MRTTDMRANWATGEGPGPATSLIRKSTNSPRVAQCMPWWRLKMMASRQMIQVMQATMRPTLQAAWHQSSVRRKQLTICIHGICIMWDKRCSMFGNYSVRACVLGRRQCSRLRVFMIQAEPSDHAPYTCYSVMSHTLDKEVLRLCCTTLLLNFCLLQPLRYQCKA